MGLKDIGESLPPGFRFYPSDEELVCHYLHKKIANEDILKGTLVEIDLHTCEPWQLPEVAKLNGSDWYFFSFRDRKYATGFRTNRATTCGYWKATGKDRVILDPNTQQIVGMRKTLVFYKNRAPNGMKTGWIMHEFRLETPHMPPKEDWVLCRVFEKNKGEDPHLFDTTNTSSYPTLTNGDQNMMNYKYQLSNSIGFNQPSQTLTCNYQNALDNSLILLNPNCNNMLQLLKEGNSSGDVSSFNDLIMADLPKNDDDDDDDDDDDQQYGLQWDMMGHGISHGYHHHHGLDGMGFEDDNGVVLL